MIRYLSVNSCANCSVWSFVLRFVGFSAVCRFGFCLDLIFVCYKADFS